MTTMMIALILQVGQKPWLLLPIKSRSSVMHLIEAKMGERGRSLDGIKQLSTASRHLGTYTQSFYAITVPPESAHEAITIAARIQVISLPGYVRGADTLTHDDEMKLVSIVEKALKG